MAEDNTDVQFATVDVDDNAETAQNQKIEAMPTFKFYKNGVVVDTIMGANAAQLKSTMDKHK